MRRIRGAFEMLNANAAKFHGAPKRPKSQMSHRDSMGALSANTTRSWLRRLVPIGQTVDDSRTATTGGDGRCHDRESSHRRMSARCEQIQTRAIHLCLEGARSAWDAVIGMNLGRFSWYLPRVRAVVPSPLPSTTATGLRLRASSSLFRPPYTPARTQAPWCRPSANPGLFNPWHPCWLRFAPQQDTLGC